MNNKKANCRYTSLKLMIILCKCSLELVAFIKYEAVRSPNTADSQSKWRMEEDAEKSLWIIRGRKF